MEISVWLQVTFERFSPLSCCVLYECMALRFTCWCSGCVTEDVVTLVTWSWLANLPVWCGGLCSLLYCSLCFSIVYMLVLLY